MAKSELPDFYDIVGKEEKYLDDWFAPDNTALFWDSMGEGNGVMAQAYLDVENPISWVRASESFPTATLFGTGITSHDINQGFIGNCWFMSSCAALAEYGGRIEHLFLNQ